MVLQRISEGEALTDTELADFISHALATTGLDGKRLLFLIPDHTRSMPLPVVFAAVFDALDGRVAKLDYLVALGTHPPLSEEALNRLVGITVEERAAKYKNVGIYNHEWKNPDALTSIGTITEEEIAAISSGLMRQHVDVTVNKMVFDYDVVCVIGPVFPHEVVGFSGGNKYFFPGIAGQTIIDLFHWLGALITNPVIEGVKHTPVREVVDRAASLIGGQKLCFCLNVTGKNCKGIFFGSPEEAWDAAADLAAQTHIVYKAHSFASVLAVAPEMYDELWVAGKCMYKLEPVVADGGELIIYAPHLCEISATHGHLIRRVGYHTRDYILAHMHELRDVPGGVLAHSTHVRGIGTYEDGVERPRIDVTLATAIPEDECRTVNLGYRDPATIDPDQWRDREDEGRLLVPHAGEVLYRLKEQG
ncbi:MAG TPA: DUF2088 domain-containing protein [Candidatus Hydrogenedentes bacterium]|nr:DUF2088 domain-containing protein [Candidatus Hydrogenedentota bacterium]